MKKLGIIGGLGPDTSIYYYRTIIDLARQNLKYGKVHPEIEIFIYNVNQNQCAGFMEKSLWREMANKLINAAWRLHKAGADFALIASNSPHRVFDEVKNKSPIPLLSIVEETCREVLRSGIKKVGLLGTTSTMQSGFYQNVLKRNGISVEIPKGTDFQYVNITITRELVSGIFKPETYQEYLRIISEMITKNGIEGLVLGCTELPLILTRNEFGILFFNTSQIHAEAAYRYSQR